MALCCSMVRVFNLSRSHLHHTWIYGRYDEVQVDLLRKEPIDLYNVNTFKQSVNYHGYFMEKIDPGMVIAAGKYVQEVAAPLGQYFCKSFCQSRL
ncbi:hypothetical protein C5167_001912 [Papaver somniferum]|uniref:Uncharacterized protein n=1 Tax=Papaver somniferum TaxID=3469 RepID=A0A4Y7KZB2_PAPSO|nr:hypothetical protein C5167_001912 [Papaver somniferum]